ncbi:MAG TPA: UvrD-helicase domain-containing protein [Streptosporangiaceae bacterium]|nr:UvrD-helicase domain-containing protein [Streptosporangiaceae bacterium]
MFHADLHVHSRFSRACSKDAEIGNLAWWAARKGLSVIGTGDFTHPAWAAELAESLVPAEPGLLALKPELVARLRRTLPPGCQREIRFLLSTEISTIYKRDGATRKVHHLLYAPTFEAASAITTALAKVGNLASDGRPILGLDSRHLLEITLNAGPGCFLIPAHIWTPWFAVLGSKSGFDAVPDCYLDLAEHVFAVETGLSSDPPMNWICSGLDHYRLVSNSDAHSPPMLGREATTFSTAVDYFAMLRALRTGQGLAGTLNFFPEGGRYHADGHRKCGVRLLPAESVRHAGLCPKCGKPLTIGVMNRVAELADRPEGYRPLGAAASANLVSLPEIIGEIRGAGRQSKRVTMEVDRLVATLGPELHILLEADTADIGRTAGSMVAEAITRLRSGEVTKEAGYDGEYGVIRLFRPEELAGTETLFDIPATGAEGLFGASAPETQAGAAQPDGAGTDGGGPNGGRLFGASAPETQAGAAQPDGGEPDGGRLSGSRVAEAQAGVAQPDGAGLDGAGLDGAPARGTPAEAASPDGGQRAGPGSGGPSVGHESGLTDGSMLAGLDPSQREAAQAPGPLLILAGPGTGKTRTLTHRIAGLAAGRGVPPEACLALTFTRRAAVEMRERLAVLLPAQAGRLMITTFHGLGLTILREHAGRAGLDPGFAVADEKTRLGVAVEEAGSMAAGRRLLAEVARDPGAAGEFARLLASRGLVDFDGLITLPLAMLRQDPALAAALAARWQSISVDEYQDTDAAQYALLRLLAGDGSGLAVIGDPDQAIYGFRGADVGFFLSFGRDFPGARTVTLTRNYRSSPVIVAGAMQAVAPATLVPGRRMSAAAGPAPGAAERITVHEAASDRAEGAWIAQAIDKLLGGASFHSLDTGRADGHAGGKLALADIAVLYRTEAQAAALGQALTRAGLPFQKRSHDLLGRRTAVPEILREMAPNPGGASVAKHLGAAVHRLASRSPDARAAGRRTSGGGLSQVDVLAAGEVLAPLAQRCGADFERFLTEIALGAEADALDPRADAVTLLTIHAAKGLEFGVVFVAGCERDLMPLWLPGKRPARGKQPDGPGEGSGDERAAPGRGKAPGASGLTPGAGTAAAAPGGTDVAEERRLLFVAMTRARTHLFLTCAARRRRHSAVTETGPSPFVASIDPRLLDRPAVPRPRRPEVSQPRLL